MQGLELSLADGMFWIPGGGGTCGSVTGPQVRQSLARAAVSLSSWRSQLPQTSPVAAHYKQSFSFNRSDLHQQPTRDGHYLAIVL